MKARQQIQGNIYQIVFYEIWVKALVFTGNTHVEKEGEVPSLRSW